MDLTEPKPEQETVEVDVGENIPGSSPALSAAESVARSISKVRLTLDEIIANDNERSRNSYLSPASSPTISDVSSVSSGFSSIDSVSERSSLHSVSSSTLKTFQTQYDPFRGIEVDDFSHVDRYGFLLNTGMSRSKASNEFLTVEREKL